MELISQDTKRIMEGCKERARDAGLKFDDESLEYIVTNHDMIDLSPKGMIPTLYDYWVNDLEIIKGRKEYEIYPHNAYETVINSRPAISFYNDNNPDWLNVMIFYHVLGHIDFFQNNNYYRNTWNDDFVGQALADKRLINSLRATHGRWVDYVIEFSRGVNNICGYYDELNLIDKPKPEKMSKVSYFFDVFLQSVKKVSQPLYLKEIDHYNKTIDLIKDKRRVDSVFITEIKEDYPEFETLYKKYIKDVKHKPFDVLQYVMQNSTFLKKDENKWMLLVMEIVRNTALYFEPQRRTKIANEGWASFWHDKLFIADDRIKGHEADYARINSYVTAIPRVGINPYAVGSRMFEMIEENASKGKFCYEFEKLYNADKREEYSNPERKMKDYLFFVRANYCDFTFINKFITQDFTDKHNLVLIGERIDYTREVKEYYIKSKRAEDYKKYLIDSLIHPPHITSSTSEAGVLVLTHEWEGFPIYQELMENTMIGLEFLWGGEVHLITRTKLAGNLHETCFSLKNKNLYKTFIKEIKDE